MQPKTIKSTNNNKFENGRRPQFCFKWEDDLNFVENGIRPQKNNATKNNGCGTAHLLLAKIWDILYMLTTVIFFLSA